MQDFLFEGKLGASKSIYNRALIISSFNPEIEITGESSSDDINLMKSAVHQLETSQSFDCGSAGTVLRFLSLRLARKKGLFQLKGTPRLLSRLLPQLQQTLSQLGAESRLLDEATLQIDADTWRPRGDGLWIPSGESSQFASAVLLNAWNMKSALHFVRSGELVSDSYFQLSLDLVESFGMDVEVYGNEVSIAAGQKPTTCQYEVECDVSSAFAVAALAALAGHCHIHNFPEKPLQPDAIFVAHLIKMGVNLSQSDKGLSLDRCDELGAVDADLNNSPDLFPVLASLACFAKGISRFRNLTHLVHKESNRLEKVIELTTAMGARWTGSSDSEMQLEPPAKIHSSNIDFHSDEDHRLVMAAAVAQAGGYKINVSGASCISKSFKGFEDIWSL